MEDSLSSSIILLDACGLESQGTCKTIQSAMRRRGNSPSSIEKEAYISMITLERRQRRKFQSNLVK